MNTLEGPEVLATTSELLAHTPVLGFMHNASLIRNLPEYRPLLGNPRLRLTTLAPYVTEDVARTAPAGRMVPVYFFDRPLPRLAYDEGKRRFCVQGYFDPKRRHYGQLLEAFTALRAEGCSNFEDMNNAELAQRRARVAAVKQRFLQDSRASLANALAAAGLRQG